MDDTTKVLIILVVVFTLATLYLLNRYNKWRRGGGR